MTAVAQEMIELAERLAWQTYLSQRERELVITALRAQALRLNGKVTERMI
jgi:hypothetical protein